MKKIFYFTFIISFFISLPQAVWAAEVFLKTIDTLPDGSALVEVYVDPQSKNLNVVEGVILFRGVIAENLSVEAEIGNSILTIWPLKPEYSVNEKTLRFTGGTPLGFDKRSPIMRVVVSSSLAGTTTLAFVAGEAYLSDGRGTKDPISGRALTLNLKKQDLTKIEESRKLIMSENVPPKLGGQKDTMVKFNIIFILVVLILVLSYVSRKFVKK